MLGVYLHVVRAKVAAKGRGYEVGGHLRRVRVDGLGILVVRLDQTCPGTGLIGVHHPVQAEGYVFRRNGFAVPERGVGVQTEHVAETVRCHLPTGGQVTPDIQPVVGLRVELDQANVHGAVPKDVVGRRTPVYVEEGRSGVSLADGDAAQLGSAGTRRYYQRVRLTGSQRRHGGRDYRDLFNDLFYYLDFLDDLFFHHNGFFDFLDDLFFHHNGFFDFLDDLFFNHLRLGRSRAATGHNNEQ